ncbi:MAG TPA: phytoene/squalene synthase family protein [Steroidobacteraceae bacterium]|jgi:farnesyl-diphosphate farnesyltransferase|nr:phytoene/squalene synthase family protein [Steroidobacteraceae bacterium]
MGLQATIGPEREGDISQPVRSDSPDSDECYQDRILPEVSRTFALTIPQLPPALRGPVTSAYLLCRIADTIEDEPALSPAETLAYLQRFKAVVSASADPSALANDLSRRLSNQTLDSERELVRNMERVVRVTQRLEPAGRAAIGRCVRLMCDGMPQFQLSASLQGLGTASDLDDYCYYVAGVVGEMLVELFCSYSPRIAQQREALYELATSFAQGLQMTNILKDQWEDRRRGACWLPQEVFARHGIDVAQLSPQQHDRRFAAGLRELIGIAHAHLRNALTFTLLIPRDETGIRRFCLWAIGLAVLTLRKISANPAFVCGTQVKVTRTTVTVTRVLTSVAVGNNWMLKRLFARAARGLPLAPSCDVRLTGAARMRAAMEDEGAPVQSLVSIRAGAMRPDLKGINAS